MSGPVEVLAVLDAAIVGIVKDPIRERRGHRESLIAARAAVAELIEASRRAERLLRDMAEAGFGDPAQADDLRAARARIGGAK